MKATEAFAPTFSVIVPVYNRPDEAAELLASLAEQTETDFELILVEDGSTLPCEEVAQQYSDRIRLRYFAKPNSGPGDSRNFGVAHAQGTYVVFFDSDCIIPSDYFAQVKAAMHTQPVDFWGGPDKAHPNFNRLQKAISFAMTSWLTTGGIRGSKPSKKFLPRTFNMGMRRSAFVQLRGFANIRTGEDIELSMRARRAGLHTVLIPKAYVYHKRRTSLKQYHRQVYGFGKGRIHARNLHGSGLKLVHTIPFFYSIFTLAVVPLFLLHPAGVWPLGLWLMYNVLLFAVSSMQHASVPIGLLSVVTTQVMMFGYGRGLAVAACKTLLYGKQAVSGSTPKADA